MTGNRTMQCLFCRVLRVLEQNRGFKHAGRIRSRVPVQLASFLTTRGIRSSSVLSIGRKDSDSTQDIGASTQDIGASESSSSDSSSSDSSGSDSELEAEVDSPSDKKTHKVASKPVNTPDLLSLLRAGEKKWGGKKEAESNLKNIQHSIDAKLVSEAKKLSEVLPGDKTKTESALLGQLLSQFDTTTKQKRGEQPRSEAAKKKSISDIMEGITIEKSKTVSSQKGSSFDRFEHVSDAKEDRKKQMAFREPGMGLFNGKPLGIFTKDDLLNARQEKKSLFEVVAEEEKEQLQFYPPRNAFEEQIQWTTEGKLWTFPIDNEAGWEDEKKVEFHEHVFLENQLSDFPKKGPIRHFMELVTVALSKNPYLTVQQKHEHIDWYRNYFQGKQNILEERLGKDGIIGSKGQEKLKEG